MDRHVIRPWVQRVLLRITPGPPAPCSCFDRLGAFAPLATLFDRVVERAPALLLAAIVGVITPLPRGPVAHGPLVPSDVRFHGRRIPLGVRYSVHRPAGHAVLKRRARPPLGGARRRDPVAVRLWLRRKYASRGPAAGSVWCLWVVWRAALGASDVWAGGGLPRGEEATSFPGDRSRLPWGLTLLPRAESAERMPGLSAS